MKKELRWAPILGLYALRIGSTPVARGDAVEGDEGHGRACRARRGEARQLVIYPQGTRVVPGARLPFKVGAGVLYERLGRDLRAGGDQRRGVLGAAEPVPAAGARGGRVPRRRSRRGCRSPSSWRGSRRWSRRSRTG